MVETQILEQKLQLKNARLGVHAQWNAFEKHGKILYSISGPLLRICNWRGHI
jgi:hypothetical protein